MAKVIEIAISDKSKGQMSNVDSIEAIAGKGLIGDRHFKENNGKHSQITLIEIENINHFNKISETSIPAVDFRRNIVTENIRLNELIDKEFFVGNVKLKGHDLCRPCKYLQEKLKRNYFIKEFLHKGGLRCEILTDGKINVGDSIKYI